MVIFAKFHFETLGCTMDIELREALSQRIRGYLDTHPRATLRSLAKRSGLSTMTVSRLAQGEVLKPSLEAAVAIIGVVAEQQDVAAFLQRYFPETFARFEKISQETTVMMAHDELELILDNPVSFAIFDLASMHAGITRDRIASEFGKYGIQWLDAMIHAGTLYEEGNGSIYHKKHCANLALNASDVVKKLRYRLDLFQNANLGTRAARLANLSESLNREGMERVHEALSVALEKIQAIRKDPSLKGDLPVFVGLVMNLVHGVLPEASQGLKSEIPS
jgi:transcriptional regulator with XRE-family HTH domain